MRIFQKNWHVGYGFIIGILKRMCAFTYTFVHLYRKVLSSILLC